MKTTSLIITILSFMILLIESINNFEKTKIAYASFDFNKNFYIDKFKPDDKGYQTGVNSLYIWADGTFCSDGTKTHFDGPSIYNNLQSDKNGNIPVWRCRLTSKHAFYIGYGRLDNLFTYNMRDYFLTLVFLVLLFPSTTCYIFLKIRQNKNKKLQNISK